MRHVLNINSESPSETEDIGLKLGLYLKKTLKSSPVFLYGDLGAGKTTFIKGFASAFGIPKKDIGSASFVIVAEYDTMPPFYHIDLYRIEKEEDADSIGVWEYIESEGIAVIEWSERLSYIPEGSVKVTITYKDENSREIIIEGVESFD